MAEYFLPHHVHFCCRGNDFVFLDLRQDDYTLVNGVAAAALRDLSFAEQAVQKPESVDALKELLNGGLLITDQSNAKRLCSTKTELAMESLIDPEAMPRARLGVLQLWRFIAACTAAATRLRWGRLESTVKSVERRKNRHYSTKSFDMDRARELTAVFQTLRSFFPRDYLCLYDSLALLEFLARHQVFPTWIFGVKLEPWAAHCWVQEGQCVFNEGVEEAAGYTPIMAI